MVAKPEIDGSVGLRIADLIVLEGDDTADLLAEEQDQDRAETDVQRRRLVGQAPVDVVPSVLFVEGLDVGRRLGIGDLKLRRETLRAGPAMPTVSLLQWSEPLERDTWVLIGIGEQERLARQAPTGGSPVASTDEKTAS